MKTDLKRIVKLSEVEKFRRCPICEVTRELRPVREDGVVVAWEYVCNNPDHENSEPERIEITEG